MKNQMNFFCYSIIPYTAATFSSRIHGLQSVILQTVTETLTIGEVHEFCYEELI